MGTLHNIALEILRAASSFHCMSTSTFSDVAQEPTAAATDPHMQALIVSQETVPGAEAINKDRQHRGFSPLSVFVVDLVGTGSKELNGEKLSSTALRARDAGELS